MHSTSIVVVISVAIAAVCIIVSCYQSTIQTSAFLGGLLLKLLVTDIFPALDSPHELAKVRTLINGQPEPTPAINVTILNIRIASSVEHAIPIRIYIPNNSHTIREDISVLSTLSLKPVLIWFHGGGFVTGNYSNENRQCGKIVEYTGFIVVNVDYRLAPENKFPDGVNDAVDTLMWTKNNIKDYGGDSEQIYLSGESSGGTIATATTAVNYDPIRTDSSKKVNIKGLFILYPCLEHGVYRDSHFRYSNAFALLTLKQMSYFWSLYLNDQWKDSLDYRACPLRTPRNILRQFPPTLIVLAKNDILLDEGLAFEKLLKDVQVSVETTVYNNVYHGFFARPFLSNDAQTKEVCESILLLNKS